MIRKGLEWLDGVTIVATAEPTNEERVKEPHRRVFMMVSRGRQTRDLFFCCNDKEAWLEVLG